MKIKAKPLEFLKKHVVIFLKAIVVGATLRVPGMSGGTTAIILKIYDKLLHAVNTFFKNIKENILFLGVFALGGGLAFLACNSVIYKITSAFPAICAYFFAGIILFGIPSLIKEAGITYRRKDTLDENATEAAKNSTPILNDLILFVAGAIVVVGIGLFQNQGLLSSSGYTGFGQFIFNLIAGFFAGIALVLPGISFTYFLTVIGLMDTLSESISLSSIDPVFLATFGVGVLLGLIATAKISDRFIQNHKRGTYVCIIGFLAGSVIMLLTDPQNIPKVNEIIFCILFFIAGAAIILTATHLASVSTTNPDQTDKHSDPPSPDVSL